MAKTDTKGRLVYIEPNDIQQEGIHFGDGAMNDNVPFRPEDMSMSVDLQVVVPQITDKMKAQNEYFDVTYSNGTPKYISFLQGSKIGQKQGSDGKYEDINELTDSFTEISSTYSELGTGARDTRENLGINSIDINFNSQFFPVVKMSLTDVRGSALMSTAEQDYFEENKTAVHNFYSALFHFPYPRFLLSIKGYYGNKITFILAVEDVKTSLNSETGNFDVDISFIGYMYGLYTDIPFTFLIAAPYIGGVADNGETQLETNTYWKDNENFRFANSDGSNGEHICTFIEYLEKYNEVQEKIAKGDITLTNNMRDYSRAKSQLSAIQELKESCQKTLDTFYDENKGSITCAYTNDEYFKIYFGRKATFLANANVNDGFINLLSTYANNYSTTLTQSIWTAHQDRITGKRAIDGNSDSFVWKSPITKAIGLNHYSGLVSLITKVVGDDKLEDRLENLNRFIGENVKNIGENTYYYVLWTNRFIEKMDNTYEQIEDDINKNLMDYANEDIADSISLALGFRLSLENVFRMIFAHLDTFIHFINRTVSAIDDNRLLKDYLDKDETNIETNGILPPFFGYYTQGKDNKREFTYPGKRAKMRNFPEVQLVEDICNGIMSCHNREKTIIREANDTGNTSSSNTVINSLQGEKFIGNFIPTLLTDIFRENNPYSEYGKDQRDFTGTEEDCALIYYYFYARYISAKWNGRQIDDEFITTEVKNFHDANPQLRRIMFDILKDSSKAYERLKNFCEKYNQNNSRYLFDFFEEGIKVGYDDKKDKLPIVYKSPLRKNESNIQKTDKGFDDIVLFKSDRVDLFAKDIDKEKLNIETEITYRAAHFGHIYYDATDGADNDINSVKKGIMPAECEDYDSFIKWIQKSPEENTKMCRYPILQVGGDDKNIKNLFDDEDFRKLSATEDGLYKQGLLFLACLYGNSTDNTLPKNIESNFIRRYPKVYILYVGGLFYRKEKGFFTDKKEFFRIDMPWYSDIVPVEGNVDKDAAAEDYSMSPWFARTENITVFRNLFKEWCSSWFQPLYNEFIERDKIQGGRTVWTIKNNKKHIIKALPLETQQKIIGLYLEMVDVGRTKLLYTKKDFGRLKGITNGLSKSLTSFAKALYESYDNNEKQSVGATNDESESKDDSNARLSYEQKTSVYYTLSNLYTKWLVTFNEKSFKLKSPSEEIETRKKRFETPSQYDGEATEYGNFLFLDSYQNDISQKMFINPESLYDKIKAYIEGETDVNNSVFQFMSYIAQDNKLLFLALPVYNNFYNVEALKTMFTPQSIYGENSKNTLGYGNTYILMYTHEVSKFLDSREEEDVRVADDKLDMADTWGNIKPQSLEYFKAAIDANDISINVPAFGVTYGKQNQNYFKHITLNMDTPQVTDYSIMNQLKLAEGGAHGDVAYPKGVGQDMFGIYSNRSYTCTVEMMGCMNIMPMMYFQLNNIPMFKGAYMIIKVEHHIQAGDIVTRFTGVRISKNQMPYIKTVFNLENIIDKIGGSSSSEGSLIISDEGRISEGNNTFGGISRSASELPNGLQRDKGKFGDNAGDIIWDENGELIIPAASKPEGTFNVLNAIREMSRQMLIKSKNKIIIPSESRDSSSSCAAAVKKFVIAGGIKEWNGANGAYCYNVLAARGFGVYTRGLKNKDKRLEWIKNYAQAGDIALMEIDNGYGHICMYDGRSWVSDFKQNEIWVYGSKGQPKSDIIIMRYIGARLMPDGSLKSDGKVSFWNYSPILKFIEGKYSNIEGDNGGKTVSGVTQSMYQTIYGSNKDVINITEDEWNYVMKNFYWDSLRCDEMNNQKVSNLIADWGINSGTGTAAKKVNALLGLQDSIYIKDVTIETINQRIRDNADAIINEIAEARREHYRNIVKKNSSQIKFLDGWLNRIDTLLKA